MITFFRKIRAALLVEGKTGKYLKYAIGEIFLVVIGILIALSINNWNEARKIEILIGTYKTSLVEDLTQEIVKSQRAISDMEEELEVLFDLNKRISRSPMNMDTIVKIYRFEFDPEFNSYDINLTTLDALINTGNINLLEKDLYKSLMDVKGQQEKTIKTINVNTNFFMAYSTRINVPFHDDWNSFHGEPLERIWEDIDKNGFLRDFSATLTSKKLINQFIIQAQKEYIKKMESVLIKLTEQDMVKN